MSLVPMKMMAGGPWRKVCVGFLGQLSLPVLQDSYVGTTTICGACLSASSVCLILVTVIVVADGSGLEMPRHINLRQASLPEDRLVVAAVLGAEDKVNLVLQHRVVTT
jgi:hypothetical protein